jgi:hypothetical protein
MPRRRGAFRPRRRVRAGDRADAVARHHEHQSHSPGQRLPLSATVLATERAVVSAPGGRASGELQVCRPPTRGPCFAADAVLRHTDPGDAAQLALRRTQVAVREHLCLSRRLLPIVTSRACASPGSACSRRSARYCFALDPEATPLQVRRIVVDAGVAGRWSRPARSDMLGI